MKTARPSQEQVMAIVAFMETHSVLGLGRAKGWKERVEMKKLRSQVTTILNSLPGPTRSAESWMKFWSDKKLAVRQKVITANGDLEICTDIEKKIWDLFISNTEPVVRRQSVKEQADHSHEDSEFEPETIGMEPMQDDTAFNCEEPVLDAEEPKDKMSRPSKEQLSAIIDYMEKNPSLAIGKVTSWQDMKMWNQLMRKLNTLPGPMKPLKSWMKYWSDKKCAVKEKIMMDADSYNLCSDIDKRIWDLILGHCVEFHSPRPSQEQVTAIVNFMERHRKLGIGNARSLKAKEERKKLWTQLMRKVNTLPGPTRSLKAWVKYWNDKKSAVRNKVMSSENSYIYCSDVEKKIWDLFFTDEKSKVKNNLTKTNGASASLSLNDDWDNKADNITPEQEMLMIDIMEKNSNLATCKDTNSKYVSESQWQQLVKSLNSLPGPSRTVKSWMKSWHDRKQSVLKKMKSGDEGYSQCSDVELRIWNLLTACNNPTEESQDSATEDREESNGLEEIYLEENGNVDMEQETGTPQPVESDDEVLANKKRPFPSEEQIEAIVSFMEEYPALGRGGRSAAAEAGRGKRLWRLLTRRLNELPGPTRTVKVWMKYWYSKKRTVRQKAASGGARGLCSHERRIWRRFLAHKSVKNPIKVKSEMEDSDVNLEEDNTENRDDAETSDDCDETQNDVMEKALQLISSQTTAMREMAQAATLNAQASRSLADAAHAQARALEQLSSSFSSINSAAKNIQNSLDNIDATMKRFCADWKYPDR